MARLAPIRDIRPCSSSSLAPAGTAVWGHHDDATARRSLLNSGARSATVAANMPFIGQPPLAVRREPSMLQRTTRIVSVNLSITALVGAGPAPATAALPTAAQQS